MCVCVYPGADELVLYPVDGWHQIQGVSEVGGASYGCRAPLMAEHGAMWLLDTADGLSDTADYN